MAPPPLILMVLLGRGGQDVLTKIQVFSEYRLGTPEVQVGMELSQESDFSAELTPTEFTKNPKPLPTSPELRAARRRPLSPEAIELRRRKMVELCWSAAVSLSDICARRARMPPGFIRCRVGMSPASLI